MTVILLSVRPVYAAALLAGTKTAEVRRRFPEQPRGTEIFIYSSSPDRSVAGTVRLDAIDRPSAADVWEEYREQIMIEELLLNDYLGEVDAAAILQVTEPTRWQRPVPLLELRQHLGVEPPQSFRYLNEDQALVLRALGGVRSIEPAALSTGSAARLGDSLTCPTVLGWGVISQLTTNSRCERVSRSTRAGMRLTIPT